MRKVLVVLEVDDDRAIAEGVGTIEYIEKEMGWVEESGISLADIRILDDDDENDTGEIEMANLIFEE